MVQNCCRQIKAVARQLLPALHSQEARARKVSMLILNEVGPGGAGQGAPRGPPEPLLRLPQHPIRTHPHQDLSLTLPPSSPPWGSWLGLPPLVPHSPSPLARGLWD